MSPANPAPVEVRASRHGVKSFVKLVLHGLATIVITPVLLGYWLGSAVLGRDRALESASQTLALLPGISGMMLRRAFLARVLTRCDRSAEICFGTLFSQTGSIIEADVYVGPRCHLGLVHLEKDVLIAAGVHIPSGGQTHYSDDPTRPIREQGGERTLVRIGSGAWIGSAAIVMADVGAGCIVGAGSVVTKPLPPNVIAAGVPARIIRSRFEPASQDTDGKK